MLHAHSSSGIREHPAKLIQDISPHDPWRHSEDYVYTAYIYEGGNSFQNSGGSEGSSRTLYRREAVVFARGGERPEHFQEHRVSRECVVPAVLALVDSDGFLSYLARLSLDSQTGMVGLRG